jgi:hypothetical protein
MLSKFYWATTKKTIAAFGTMFNNIIIDRKNVTDDVVQSLRIPLSYAPKQKFLARIEAMPNDDRNFEVLLPRMAFEITGVEYDASRKINSLQQLKKINADCLSANWAFSPAPYNIAIALYIYSKNQEDALQIVEQILPYFQPDFNLAVNTMPDLDITQDVPVTLNTVSYADEYEGDFVTRRAIIWTLAFTLKVNFFGPLHKQGVIRKVTETITISEGEVGNDGETLTYEFTEFDL